MHVVITGADGFVGRALMARLLQERRIGERPVELISALDVRFAAPSDNAAVRQITGSLADASALNQVFDRRVEAVFHLASIPGGTAERQYALARDVNLLGTLALLERAQAQVGAGAPAPRFVFASTIAVFGSPMPSEVNDDTALNPQMTYGAQKLIGEVLVSDFSRRGWVDGRSLRLPGVLARPPERTGQLSAFISDIIRELGAGRAFTCPTSPEATTWASSIHCIVDNLVHAAVLDASALGGRRSFTLPALQFSMGSLVDAIAEVHGTKARDLVSWDPQPNIEALFGRFPPLRTQAAEAAGFRHDGSLPGLVRRALAPCWPIRDVS